MLYALLICSDEECTEIFEAHGSLEELEALACDCGCALEIVAVSNADAEPHRAAVDEAAAPPPAFELTRVG